MEDYKREDPDKLLKKITNTPIMAYFALGVSIIFFLMFIFGIISIFNDKILAIILIIVGSIFSISFFFIYFFQSRKVKSNIKNIDLEKVKKEILEGVISNGISKTYFTKSYMMANYYYGFIVEYKDILWIYKRSTYDPQTLVMLHDLAVCDNKGKKYFTIYEESFVDEILKHNKNVIKGKSKENKEKYKELIKNINERKSIK